MQWWLRWTTVVVNRHLRNLTWPALAGLVVGHALSSYILLSLAGEGALTDDPSRYFYWFMVTISTVGYGDHSPSSTAGMWAVSLWVIPLGLGLFGAVIGKLATSISMLWEQTMKGERDFSHLSDHIVILGWQPRQTLKIIDLILGDSRRQQRQILLCVTEEMEHPCPERPEVSFIRLDNYTDPASLARTGLVQAAKIIIDGASDEETLAIALRVGAMSRDAHTHVSAYFNNESVAQLVEGAHAHIEVSTSREAEILTRSMQDPGSSRIYQQLMDTRCGATQFSLTIPTTQAPIKFGALFEYLKRHHSATLLGIAEHITEGQVTLNPDTDSWVNPGSVLYYIATQRLHSTEINWSQVNGL